MILYSIKEISQNIFFDFKEAFMAIITFSRQVAALGDEIAKITANKLGFKFINRQQIEDKILELGFPQEKLKNYDEKKPNFFASLVKERDEYLDYLQTAILESASSGDCVLIGRGASIILSRLPNHISVRCVSDLKTRTHRLMNEFEWDEKKALQRIQESDLNRAGFHKSFFNVNNEDPSLYFLTINSALLTEENAASIITETCARQITPEKESQGKKKLLEMLEAQRLVNKLSFEHKIAVNFLRAEIEGQEVTLYGVADSAAISEIACALSKEILPTKTIISKITVVQDFKSYP